MWCSTDFEDIEYYRDTVDVTAQVNAPRWRQFNLNSCILCKQLTDANLSDRMYRMVISYLSLYTCGRMLAGVLVLMCLVPALKQMLLSMCVIAAIRHTALQAPSLWRMGL